MFATFRNTAFSLGAAALALAAPFASPAQAAYIVTLRQVGANVVATGSGSLDTSALGSPVQSAAFNSIAASVGFILLDDTSVSDDRFSSGVSGPLSFGGGGGFAASSATNGVAVDIQGDFHGSAALSVPGGYVSGTPLGTSTITFNSTTLAALGVTPGTYDWTWGTGATADSFTLQIGPVAAVPEPASLPLLVMSLVGLGMVVRTRRA